MPRTDFRLLPSREEHDLLALDGEFVPFVDGLVVNDGDCMRLVDRDSGEEFWRQIGGVYDD